MGPLNKHFPILFDIANKTGKEYKCVKEMQAMT